MANNVYKSIVTDFKMLQSYNLSLYNLLHDSKYVVLCWKLDLIFLFNGGVAVKISQWI